MRWLDALIWPEQQRRRDRLHAAARVARADPPQLVAGDLLNDLPALAAQAPAAQAPAAATLVVFHSAVLTYVRPEVRTVFTDIVRSLPGHWISNEGASVLPELVTHLHSRVDADGPAKFLLARDGRPVALTGPHGQEIQWFTPHQTSA